MARFKMGDGVVVDTDNAKGSWGEATRWNGNNHVSVATGSQWEHETLYLSAKGRYYVVHESQWQGSVPSATWLSREEAAAWLLANDKEVPEGLEEEADSVTE